MFKSVGARFALRASLAGLASAIGSLQGALPGISSDELLAAGLVGVGAAFAYAGIGAIFPQVEPHIGIKR